MCKLDKKNDSRKIDPCMIQVIKNLQGLKIETLACCCGHGKYPMSIIVNIGFSKSAIIPLEIFSNITLVRKKKFYKKDKACYYYIPEVSKPK